MTREQLRTWPPMGSRFQEISVKEAATTAWGQRVRDDDDAHWMLLWLKRLTGVCAPGLMLRLLLHRSTPC